MRPRTPLIRHSRCAPTTRRGRLRAALLLLGVTFPALAALAALNGCSRANGPASEGAGRLVRPTLRRVKPDAAAQEIRRVQHHLPGKQIAPWEVRAQEEPRTKRLDQGEFALRVDAWGKRRVALPGSFPSAAFNRVALRGFFPGVFSISLQLTGPDGALFESSRMATVNTREVQTVLFDLPRMRRTEVVFDRLEFLITRGSKSFEIHGVDLLEQPLALALPDPEGEGQLITIDHARHGVGIASGAPVTCSIDARPGDMLRFALGLPQELRIPGQRVRLGLTIEGQDGATLTRSFELESRISVDPQWTQVRLPLTDFDGPAEVRFEVSADGGDALCALAELALVRRGSTAPSVLLVTSDTHRGDHLGSVNARLAIETPALDALAERGVLFEDCYSSTNVTSPSHVALMTATHPRDTRLITNSAYLSEQAETLAERFRANGFMTIGVVSVRHLGPAGTGLGQGFDRMLAPISGTWDAEVAVGHVEDWLEDADGVPVFVWLHLFDAHHPYGPPGRYDRYYYPKNKDPFDAALPALEVEPEALPEDLADVRDLEFPKSQYRAEISYLDHELGRLFTHPRLQAGVLAVTADHGEILEKDGSFFNHAALYPDTLHVPMILAWPDGPRGRRVASGVEHLDLGRTLLDLAGLEQADFPGVSLVADLDTKEPASEVPHFALSAHASSASVTLRPWHFVLYLRQYKGKFARLRLKHSFELYRTDLDPDCLRDISGTEPKRVAQLRRLLVDWLTTTSGTSLTGSGQQSAAAMDQLAALGYATTTEEVDDEAWIDPDCDCELCAGFQ